jgi:hypothetical protein
MTYNLSRAFASLLLLVSGIPAMAQTQASCTFESFQVPGFTGTSPRGINRYGTVVGSVFITYDGRPPETITTPFVRYADGSVKLFHAPGTSSTDSGEFEKRNALGATVGSYENFGSFVFYNGTWQKVTGPNGAGGVGGINLYGSLVGAYSATQNGPVRGFKLKDGKYTVVSFPGAVGTWANSISDTGVIIGMYVASDGAYHGFALKNGVYTRVDHPLSVNPGSGIQTELDDINASGAMVGRYFSKTGYRTFLLKDGVFKDIAYPGAGSTVATGINGYGTITGSWVSTQGVPSGFIATNCH